MGKVMGRLCRQVVGGGPANVRGAIGRGRATVAGHALPAAACLDISRERALAAGDQISPKTPTPPAPSLHANA